MTDDIDIDRLTPGTLVGLLAGDYPQGKALYVRDDGDAAEVVRVHVTSTRERVPWESITSPPPRWAGHDDPSPMGRLRDAHTAYLDARAAEQAADLAFAEAVRNHVQAAVPAASWQAEAHSLSQTYAQVRPDAVRRGLVWVGVRGAPDGILQWRASLERGDWDTPNITSGTPLPDPAAALRELLDAVRAKARRVRRADRRAELEVAAAALAGWLDAP